jgi:hypothetical protein
MGGGEDRSPRLHGRMMMEELSEDELFAIEEAYMAKRAEEQKRQATETERAAVVAWLLHQAERDKELAKQYGERGIWNLAADYARQSGFFAHIANAIEARAHLDGPKDD